MTELVIYRGLPGSGKTTLAKAWVAEDPAHRARVNRDDLRLMLHGGYFSYETERQVTAARDRLIDRLLEKGISVANDDTNLRTKYAREIVQIGRRAGANVRVVDLTTEVDLDTCLDRNAIRSGTPAFVPEKAIRDMHDRFLSGGRVLAPILDAPTVELDGPVEPYVPKPGTPKAVMVDLDGTLCLHDGRSPYDESLVSTDLPNPAVVAAIHTAFRADYQIIFCSGRSEDCREETALWIATHVGAALNRSNGDLLMRKSGDRRRDSIVKLELFDAHIRDQYDVVYVLDDRQQVVDAWRSIGLTVFQVAPGNF